MEAVFALIGVGLGAFISGGFSLVLERRREQTRAREERRQEEQEAFAAARLLRADAQAAQARSCVRWRTTRPAGRSRWTPIGRARGAPTGA